MPNLKRPSYTVTVASAGTRVPLSPTSLLVLNYVIRAHYDNTGAIYVGDSTVDNTNMFLLPSEPEGFGAENVGGNGQEIDLSEVWIDADTSGNRLVVAYTKRI